MAGAIAAHLQQTGTDAYDVARYLQTCSPDRYVTREALELLDGAMGRPASTGWQDSCTWLIGQMIADRESPRP